MSPPLRYQTAADRAVARGGEPPLIALDVPYRECINTKACLAEHPGGAPAELIAVLTGCSRQYVRQVELAAMRKVAAFLAARGFGERSVVGLPPAELTCAVCGVVVRRTGGARCCGDACKRAARTRREATT